uniref:Uncharacterized protein n=1 Tax=Trichuris muris TaxID=70415 RepID=A0A5S6QUT5_TRIMR
MPSQLFELLMVWTFLLITSVPGGVYAGPFVNIPSNLTHTDFMRRHYDLLMHQYVTNDVFHMRSASNLYEAIVTFMNPFTGEPMVPEFRYYGMDKDGNPQIECASTRCRACARKTLNGIRNGSPNRAIKSEADLIWDQLRLDNAQEYDCQFNEKYETYECPFDWTIDSEFTGIVKELTKRENILCHNDESLQSKKRVKRRKYQAIGEYVTLHCLKRGMPMRENTQLMHLCDTCWGTIVLPDGYEPRMVSQVTCEKAESMEGYITCLNNTDLLSVEKVEEDGTRTAVKVPTSISCMPMIETTTALYLLADAE